MLRDVVYEYLWKQILQNNFKPGEFVNLNALSDILGVSRTPLREALIVLEAEGFVEIIPKRGIYIRPLTLQDMHELYEIIGSLESSIVMNSWKSIDEAFIFQLKQLNDQMSQCSEYSAHYVLNHQFHFTYISLSDNVELKKYLARLYQRIYDFSGINYGDVFQRNNWAGHETFIQLLSSGERLASADFLRDTHWKFRVPEVFTMAR